MRKLFLGLLTFLIYLPLVMAQNPPVFNVDTAKYLVLGSGINQILVANLYDGDGLEQSIHVEATSSDTNTLSVTGIGSMSGSHFAVVHVKEKGIPGSIVLTISATDENGSTSKEMKVQVGNYKQSGMIFEIHDAVFWQEVVPVNGTPIYSQLIQTSEGPFSTLDYSQIPITVNADCGASPPCTGNDFYTAFYRGYFIPPVSGDYTFTMKSENSVGFWLSTDEDPAHAQKLVFNGTSQTKIGTQVGNETESAPINLQAGKVYAFYATQWIIHATYGGILMAGPGIAKDYIPGSMTLPVFDPVRPTAPTEVNLKGVSIDGAMVYWNDGADNVKVTGYNIYLDGEKLNEEAITGNDFSLTGLTPDSSYVVLITSVDKMGNESFFSDPYVVNTYPQDLISPLPPTNLQLITATGQAMRIRWSGASDGETIVLGYNVFLNGNLVNPSGLIYEDSLTLRDLIPNTSYSVSITSVDAAYNESVHSDTFFLATTEFDPLGPSLGEKRARVSVTLDNISWNEGIGLNGPYENGDMVDVEAIRNLIQDFKPAAIRWGGISANSMSLEGSSGTGKSNTYARMLNFANELGAYFSLTVGVQDGIDYRTDPNTFMNLLEYLAGPSTSTWGAKRATEGFTEPLLQKSKGVLIEFGNEVWGAAVHNAEIGSNYSLYGKWCRDAAAVIRSSPYYDPLKIKMVYSGRNPSPTESYGLNTTVMTGDTGQVDCLAVSGYLGGNLNYDPDVPTGKTEGEYYKYRIAQAASNISGMVQTMKDMISYTGTIKPFYLYEANATTPSYNGRLGQAIVMTDYLVTGMSYGSILPSIFHLTGGEWKITVPGDGYKHLPLFETARYFNRFGKGNVLKTTVQTNDLISDGNGQTLNWNPVGSYASNNDTSFTVALFSRDFENDYLVQLDLPDNYPFGAKAVKFVLTGIDFSTRDIQIDSSVISLSDSMFVIVPKYSMVIISFSGENPQLQSKDLGYFTRIRPNFVGITAETAEQITVDKQKLYFKVTVKPDDAFSKTVTWEVAPNTLNPVLSPSNTRIGVKGSGACDGNGEIIITARAKDNLETHDSYNLTISNQGTNCNSGIDDPVGSGLFYYPNPANDLLFVKLEVGEKLVEIYDLTGKKVRSVLGFGLNTVSVKDLANGIYLVKKSGKNVTSGKLIINR